MHYKKNYHKADAILKLTRRHHLNQLMKFIIFSNNKEKEYGIGKLNKNIIKDEKSFVFVQKLAFALKYHEQAKEFTVKFYQLMTSNTTNYNDVYDCVKKITKTETRARNAYEELIVIQPNNIIVLK